MDTHLIAGINALITEQMLLIDPDCPDEGLDALRRRAIESMIEPGGAFNDYLQSLLDAPASPSASR